MVLKNSQLVLLIWKAQLQRGLQPTEDVVGNLVCRFVLVHRYGTAKIGPVSFFDSTTDGMFNYAATSLTGGEKGIVQLDLDWQNPVMLFLFPDRVAIAALGITYDPTNDSFWTSQLAGNTNFNFNVQNWTRDGTLLSEFTPRFTPGGGLALDYADGTLWLRDRTIDAISTFDQYSKTGQLLQTITYSTQFGNTLGAEFSFTNIPVP